MKTLFASNRKLETSTRPFSLQRLVATGVALLLLAAGHVSGQILQYTSASDFDSAIQSGSYLETFDTLSTSGPIDGPLNFSSNGFAYNLTAIKDAVGNQPDQFFNALNGSDVWVTTNGAGSLITVTFTSGNVTAVGGNFFTTDAFGDANTQSIWVEVNGVESSINIPASNASSFAGFTSSSPITSMTIFVNDPATNFATLNNLIVGESLAATPEPSVLADVGLGLIGLMAWSFWRRRNTVRES